MPAGLLMPLSTQSGSFNRVMRQSLHHQRLVTLPQEAKGSGPQSGLIMTFRDHPGLHVALPLWSDVLARALLMFVELLY